MNAQETFRQAYRELRANGRIGYMVLKAPWARSAACEALRARLERDETAAIHTRLTYAAADRYNARHP